MITKPPKPRILIVTDNSNLAEHISEVLYESDDEFSISILPNLDEVRQFLKGNKPDIIISELDLPDGLGSELLYGSIEEGDYPVIIISSRDEKNTARKIMDAGAFDFIIKSESSIATLPYIIERALRDWNRIIDHTSVKEALITSKTYLQSIFKSSSDGLFIINQDGHYIDVNPAGCSMFGYSRKKFLDSDLRMVLFPEDCDKQMDLLRDQMFEDDTRQEIELRKKDGKSIWVELTSTPVSISEDVFILLIKRDITAEKLYAIKLRESEEKFRQLIEEAGDEIFVFDQDWNTILVNQRACDNLGYSRAELLNTSLPDLDPEFLTIDKGKDFFTKIALKIPVIIESNHVRKDLSIYPVEINLIQINLGGNDVYRASVRDITERKKLINAVIKSETQFRSLVTNLPAKVIRYNVKQQDFIHLNTPEESLADSRGILLREYITGDGGPIHCEDLRHIQKEFASWDRGDNKKPLKIDYRIKGEDGIFHWEECFLFKEISPNNTLVAVMQISWDIEKRKVAEEALRRSELKYSHLFHNIPVMIAGVEMNPESYTYWNKDINWSGYTLEEWQDFDEPEKLKVIHPDDVDELVRRHNIWKDSIDDSTLSMEYRVLNKEGNYRWIECLFYKESDKSGELYAKIQLSSDITERKLVEIALKQSEQRYKEMFAHLPMKVFQFEIECNKHTYWDTKKNWCGKSIDEWNSLTITEQESYIHPKDLNAFKSKYHNWINNDNQAHLRAQNRIKNEMGNFVCIESRYFKQVTSHNQHPTIVQLSWVATDKGED